MAAAVTPGEAKNKERILEVFAKFGTGGSEIMDYDQLVCVLVGLKPDWRSKDMEKELIQNDILKDGRVVLTKFMDWVYRDAGSPLAAECGEITTEEQAEESRKIQKMGSKKRQGVAGQSIANEEVKDYVKPVYPKDAAAMEFIRRTITENDKMKVLVGHLDSKSLDDLANSFFPKESFRGDDIIRQGDDGDNMYIIADGQVDVYVARPDPATGMITPGDRGTKVVTFGAGVIVGELALLYAAPRAATIQVASPTAKLWALAQLDFKMLLRANAQERLTMYDGWLREVDLLKTLNHYELSQLADLLESRLYDEGEVIIRQGDAGDVFFILEDGTCSAFINGAEGEIEVKQYSKQGEYFGELALLTDATRKATVRATGQGASTACLSREDFSSILGPLSERMKEHADKYPQYKDLLSKS